MTDRYSIYKLHHEAKNSNNSPTVPLGRDASMKRHTGLLKKLKNITSTTSESILNDIQALTLSKYLDEIISALIETRPKHHLSWVQIASALYLRFKDEFSKPCLEKAHKLLKESCFAGNSDPIKSASARHAMRVLIDMNLTNMMPSKKDQISSQTGISDIIDMLFQNDPKFSNLSLLVSFSKTFASELTTITTSQQEKDNDAHITTPTSTPPSLVSTQIQQHILSIVNRYFDHLSKTLIKMNRQIRSAEKQNAEYELTRGNLPAERKEKLDVEKADYESILSSSQSIADSFGLQMSDLSAAVADAEEQSGKDSIGIVVITDPSSLTGEGKDLNLGVWEDEEEKAFYHEIPDLANFVPPGLLATGKAAKQLRQEQQQKEEAKAKVLEQSMARLELKDEDIIIEDLLQLNELADEETDDDPQNTLTSSVQVDLDAFISRLPSALSPQIIDTMAVDFVMINSKLARRKLVKAMMAVPRFRTDLLPYYSRLMAILNQYFEDIGELAVDHLQREFFYRFKKKEQVYVDDRLKNIKFICELVKFKVVPIFMIFRCMHKLIMDFTHFNVDVACGLVESIGKLMMRHPQAKPKFVELIEMMMRKKTTQNFDIRQSMMIESAYFVCYPVESKANQISLSPLEIYLDKLIYKDLTIKTSEKCLKQLRKLDWKNPEHLKYVIKRFLDLERIKFANIECIAWLTYELGRYYPDFKYSVVDHCLEYIRQGLEFNFFAWNQKRISMVRFISELYNYRCIGHRQVFDILYFILRFGHDKGIPRPDIHSPFDAPFDFFRIRLVCTILESCGTFFDRGNSKTKLDEFFVFFQMYIYTKIPPPMDIDFLINETVDMLRPDMVWYSGYLEAVNSVNEIAMKHQSKRGSVGDDEDDEEEERDEDRNQQRQDSSRKGIEQDEAEEDSSSEDDDSDEESSSDDESDMEEVFIINEPMAGDDVTEEEMNAFDAEYQKMVQESLESRRFEKKVQSFDVPVPMKISKVLVPDANAHDADIDRENDETEHEEPNVVAFSVLSKKGKQTSVPGSSQKQVVLPISSQFVQSALSKQKQVEKEKMALKEWVLGYGQRLEKDSTTGVNQDGPSSGGRRVIYRSGPQRRYYGRK